MEVKTEKVQRSAANKKERRKRDEGERQRASTPDLLAGRERRPNNYDGQCAKQLRGSFVIFYLALNR